jgi:alpha-tubulin suppressor-like RCC1 family protein
VRRAAALLVLVTAILVGPSRAEAGQPALTDVTRMDADGSMTCAVLADTTARCWGAGPLGDGGPQLTSTSNTPVVVEDETGAPLTGIEQVVAGINHACALLEDATAVCWGANAAGQLGDGTTTSRATPAPVEVSAGHALGRIAELAVGDFFTCARLANQQARCWGQNNGALGDGTAATRRRPAVVKKGSGNGPLAHVAQVVTGGNHACARLTTGQVRCWGDNGQAQLADGTTTLRRLPVVVRAVSGPGPLTNVAELSSAFQNTCARLGSGQVRCWGPNRRGQLGTGVVSPPTQPPPRRPRVVRAVAGPGPLVNVTTIGVGSFHACARLGNGQARCWGENVQGQIGDGTRPTPRPRPTAVRNLNATANLGGTTAVGAADQHSCALRTNTTVVCWGANQVGQLGSGSTSPRRLTPVVVVSG